MVKRMNGRDFFEKYNKHIMRIVKITKKLPKRFRTWLLNANRNKNGNIGNLVRYIAVASLAKKVGKNVAILPGAYFEYIENLSLGDNVSIHQMCYIDAEGGVEIGDNVSIAHRSTILSSNHGYIRNDTPIKYQEMTLAKTIINDNVWIGCGCVVLAGVEIGSGSVIGANSTVNRSIPENSIAVGSPARRIKGRLD